MKSILFVIPEYSHGGTNKSLENLLSLIDKRKYDISIYCLYEDGGDYYKKVFAPYVLKKSWLYYWLHDNVCTRKFMGLYNKLTKHDHFTWLYKREAQLLEQKRSFDVVVGYQEGTATKFVSFFSKGKKVSWIHCDYGAWRENTRRIEDEIIYKKIHSIVCVSESAKKSFCSLFPELFFKTHAIFNLLKTEDIRAKSKKELTYAIDGSNICNIVSLGRLNIVKQFEKIPIIANKVREMTDKPFRWYIIGDGSSEGDIKREITKYGLQNIVTLTGARNNPYPFIKDANLLVCTSKSESFSYVIAEAKVLHTPVLSNDFPVAYEVVDETMGWIANIKDMPQVLARIIDNVDNEYDRKKAAAMNFEYSNEQVLKKIDDIFQN